MRVRPMLLEFFDPLDVGDQKSNKGWGIRNSQSLILKSLVTSLFQSVSMSNRELKNSEALIIEF